MNSKVVLVSLEDCMKCNAVKEMLSKRNDIEELTLPKNLKDWNKVEMTMVDCYNVLDDLKRTAPILILPDGTKFVGQLRIMKWLRENGED